MVLTPQPQHSMGSESSRTVQPCSYSTFDEFLEDVQTVPSKSVPRGHVALATDRTVDPGPVIPETQSVATPDGSEEDHDIDGGKKSPRQYLETILSTRYGIKPCPQWILELLPSYEDMYDETTPAISEVRKYMAEKDAQLQDEDNVASIRHIFLHVKEGTPLPPALWDLHDSNYSLKKVSYTTFRFVYEAKFTPPVYSIIPSDKRYIRSWTLVVPHATTVVQVVRNNWGPSLEDLIGEFVSLGIPFFTLALSPNPPHKLPRPETVFENFSRPSSFQPNAYTYKTYELQRDDFLKHPHARAALLRGGILWRLCKASFEERLGLVNGPSSDVRLFGEAKRFPSSTTDGVTWTAWDDILTDDEVDLICGVYYVAVEDGRRKQWTTMSWWPRPNVFDKCGLWTGYWNTSCESWFQRRLDSIRCGEARPSKTAEWKAAFKRRSQNKTRLLCNLTEEASALFIGKVLG